MSLGPPALPLRTLAAQRAFSLVGFTAGSPEYSALVAPGETAARAWEMTALSGCALVAAGLWRALGVDVPELAAPYRTGTAVSRLIAVARRFDAWRTMGASRGWPDVGDMVLLAGPEHVYTVTDAGPGGVGGPVASVDGGERDTEGRETVKARERRWTNLRGGWHDTARDAAEDGEAETVVLAPWGIERPVVGWVDIELVCNGAAEKA